MVDLPPETQRISRLTPLADALACIDRLVAPVAPRRVEIERALGLSMAGDLVTKQAHPASAIALRDGVAVAAERTLDASAYAPAVLPGAPDFVEVGDVLPGGSDAVAPLEMIEVRDTAVHAVASLAPGDGVLPQGADATPGDLLAREGMRLRATDLAAIEALGLTHDVHVCVPRVRIASASGAPDRVFDAIRGLLVRAVAGAGGEVVVSDRAGVDGALAVPDTAVILIGGSGSGRRDRSVTELAHLGEVAFHGVGLAPGETAAFGMVG
jgi:molybdopterin biosynthesis enzyme